MIELAGWLILCLGMLLAMLGLPGPLLMLLVLGFWGWFAPGLYTITELLFAGALFFLAELLDQAGGFLGLRQGQAHRTAVYGSIIGGLIGALVSLPTLNPFFLLVGLLAGAVIGQRQSGSSWRKSFRAGGYFLLGKTGGYLAKVTLTVTGFLSLVVLRFI